MIEDDFGDRMKGYEAAETERRLDPTLPIVARLDGRSFSNFTRGMARPFDSRMCDAMDLVTGELVESTHASIGYTQSDEITLVWPECADGGEHLFGGKVHKLTSVLASFAASAMQWGIIGGWDDPGDVANLSSRLPHFDCRVFSVPSRTEATNAILWRAMDAKKNAVSMACRAHYSSRAMHGKDQSAMREMLAERGIGFETTYPARFRLGQFIRRETKMRQLSGEELARIPEKHRPTGPVERSAIVAVEMPDYFHKITNRDAVVFDGATPATT